MWLPLRRNICRVPEAHQAFDKNVGTYWFGQKSLNKRMRKEIEKLSLENSSPINLTAITNDALKKMRATLSVGEIVHLGKPLENKQIFG